MTRLIFQFLIGGLLALTARSLESAQPSGSSAAQQSAPTPGAQMPVDCTQLPEEQMKFSNQFTDMTLKWMFCSQLTPDQREQVMAMANRTDSSGLVLTSDQAMRKYMRDNNIPYPSGTSPRRPSSGGACPVP
jgi:hypothetical protein